MIPIRDNIPSRTTPVVNYAMMVLCGLAFFLQLSQEPQEPSLIERYGMIPARVFDPQKPIEIPQRKVVRTKFGIEVHETQRPAAEAAVPPWLTLLTCVFLHGGWLHFLGNMWFLYIFGDNVEDRFGHLGFLLFYLGCGMAASAAHLVSAPQSTMPTIGASGAIAGVMGAYLLLYPKAKVLTVIPIFFFLHIAVLPAALFLAVWFFIQFFQGTFSALSTQSQGVAWWAHIGGFVVGAGVAWLLEATKHLRPPVEKIVPNTDHVTMYRIRRPNRR